MATRKAPSIQLRRLAGELKRLRIAAHLKQEHVAERTGLDASSIYRIERAMNKPQRRTVLTLLDLYGVTDPDRRATLLDWLKEPSDGHVWFSNYETHLPEALRLLVRLEYEAEKLCLYEPVLVPGLLQTEEYARAIVRTAPHLPDDEVERRVQVRMHRQSVLHRHTPIRLEVVVDEAVIRRVVGGAAVMRAQLERLREAADHPGTTLRVLPFGAGEHPAMVGNFHVIDFATSIDAPVVYTEGSAGDAFLDSSDDVARYTRYFEIIAGRALSPAASRKLIEEAARVLR